MDENHLIYEHNGLFRLMLRSCTAGILRHVLDPAVPFVWIRNHLPNRYVQWWSTPTRLSEAGGLHDVEVRLMAFDVQLGTSRFLELLPEFEDHGLTLFQMTRKVPDTLTLDGLADCAIHRVLVQNGLHLSFFLPHAIECAQLASPQRSVLELALQKPAISAIAYGR